MEEFKENIEEIPEERLFSDEVLEDDFEIKEDLERLPV